MPAPEVTIVITTRDRPELLAEALDSALDQTVHAVEVVVVDDGSAEPVRPHRADDRLRVLRNERPGGVCAARNRGLAAARGRFVSFLDDDDRLLPHMVEASLAAAAASTLPPPVAVLSGMEEIDEQGRPTGTLLAAASLPRAGAGGAAAAALGAPPTHASLVVPTEVARAIGGFDERLPAFEHTDLFLRLHAACSVQGVEQIAYCRRIHRSARLSRDLPARVEGIQRTLAIHRDAFARHPARHAHYLGAVAIGLLRLGRWGPAVTVSTAALRLAPWRPKGVAGWLASLAGPRVFALIDR